SDVLCVECLVVSSVVRQQLSVATPTVSVSQEDPPALASQSAPCLRVTHVCTSSINASHPEQQHDSLQKGGSSIDTLMRVEAFSRLMFRPSNMKHHTTTTMK
ncbi:unnamed protein product, partial [Sphacelaria rigidula]